jgi:O-antigen/teichoic acid export membrane protein
MTMAITVGLDFNADKKVAESITFSTLIPRVVLVVFFSGAIALGAGTARSYLYIFLMGYAVVGIVFMIKYRPKWYVRKDFFARAWKFYLLGIIGTSVTYVAQIAQKEYGSYAELASLSIALLLIAGLGLVGSILIKFALPKIHEAWKRRDVKQLGKIYATHTFLSSMVNVPILIFLLFYIKPISVFIGEGYQTLPAVFMVLAVGYFFDLMTGITGTILRATEHEHLEIYNEIFRFVVGMSLIYLLHNQPYGIAYAISASMVIYNLVKFLQVYRLFAIAPIRPGHFGIFAISMLMVSLGLYAISHAIDGIAGIVVGLVLLAVFYLFALKIMKRHIDLGVYR